MFEYVPHREGLAPEHLSVEFLIRLPQPAEEAGRVKANAYALSADHITYTHTKHEDTISIDTIWKIFIDVLRSHQPYRLSSNAMQPITIITHPVRVTENRGECNVNVNYTHCKRIRDSIPGLKHFRRNFASYG